MKRIISLILCLVMLLGAVSCVKPREKNGENTSAPTQQSGQNDKNKSDEEFEALANEIFVSAVISDGMTYHQFIKDPASFGIDENDVERGWGENSLEAYKKSFEEDASITETLKKMDRSELSQANQIAYDTLLKSLETSAALKDYYYYDEPLTPFNGYHTMLPLMLTMYEIASAEDAENYLLLVKDTPRYLASISEFEKEKAQQGLFMTENALDQVIESCRSFAETGEDCFLIAFFEEELEKIDIDEAKKSALSEENRRCVVNEILPEYTSLADTLESLRANCREFKGASDRSSEEKTYYELQIKSSAAIDASGEWMADKLESAAEDFISELFRIIIKDYESAASFGTAITSGDPAKDIDYLLEITRDIYPKIPDQSITYVTIPDAIAEDFSPAAYMLSAFDDPTRNVVMLNPTADNSGLLFTMAHECFPGHLYQTQYFRNSKTIPLMQQVIAPSGYSEGWAVFSELMVAERAEKYGVNSCLLNQYNDIVCNLLIPCFISLKVNLDGWDKVDIDKALKDFDLNDEEYIDILYEYAVDVPTYFFDYAMGFLNTYTIYKSAKIKTDEQYLAFMEEYLGLGPCVFDVLFEHFGVKGENKN